MEEQTNPLFTQEEVEKFGVKVLEKITAGVKGQIGDAFYDEMSSYLFEHYSNANDRIKEKVIEQVTEEFVNDLKSYKFSKLREKLFLEHKKEITEVLTEEMFKTQIENIVQEYTFRKSYQFDWQWKAGLARFITKNAQLFVDDEKIQEYFLRQLSQKDEVINQLKRRLNEIGYLTE
jgi:hypothetical protein